MKSVSDHFVAQFSSLAGPSDGAFDGSLLGRIGDDLRHLYDEVADAKVPSNLLDLAQTIDARRMSDSARD